MERRRGSQTPTGFDALIARQTASHPSPPSQRLLVLMPDCRRVCSFQSDRRAIPCAASFSSCITSPDETGLLAYLGTAMVAGIIAMAIVGPLTAYSIHNMNWGTPRSDPAFLSVQLGDLIGFVGLSVAGLVLRKQPAAHKRLMLLVILQLSTAGFARWLGGSIGAAYPFGHWGRSFLATFLTLHLTNDLMALGVGGYDLVTRGRLHPAYVVGLIWSFG